MSDNEKEAGKRKRRRRGGLRVPSDNVPRAKSQSDVTAPAPEDPRLAVSVAYAFGSNGSAAAAPLEDESAIRDTIRNPPVASFTEDPEPPENPTIELDSVDELIEDGDLEELTEAAAERPLVDDVAAIHEHETRDVELDDEPIEYPPLDEDADENSAVSQVSQVSQVSEVSEVSAVSVPAVPGDSVDIAFDEDDSSAEETAPSAESPVDEVPEAVERSRSGGARFIRAQTMALSDNDLEELMEGEVFDAGAALGFDQRSTVRMDPLETSETSAAEEVAAEIDVDVDVDVEEPEPEPEPEPELDAAPLEPQDAGDSGEIIADDMLEEIDELAKPVEIDPETSADMLVEDDEDDEPSQPQPPPAPEPPPQPVDKRAEVSEPPPPPPTAKTKTKPKPPPAPATAEPPVRRRPKSKGKPWFEEVFDENYLRTLPFLTPQATEAEADFVVDSLGLDAGDSILDVGCGYGRHSMELAARGFDMVGLDLSLPLLLRGADEAQRRGLNINFVHGDMREMQFEAPFDGAFCLFATFGYFDDETNKLAAQQIAKALKPGARLVLDVLNRDYLIRDLPTRVWWEGDGCVILEEVDFNYFSSRIVSHRSIAFEDGRQLEQEISIRAFALHELGKLLHAAGFRVLEISGSMFTRGRFFGGQSRDIVVVAEKRGKNGSA